MPETRKKTTAKKPATAKKTAASKKPTAAKKPAAAKKYTAAKKPTGAKKPTTAKKRTSAGRVSENPVALAANRRQAGPKRAARQADLFMEARPQPKKKPTQTPAKTPPKKSGAAFGAVNVCLLAAIALLIVLGVRQQSAYAEFKRMRDVVDQQTFYEGTTIEGVDVSNMTLSAAMEYWRDRVEARNENRAVTFDDGTTVTAKELGYYSDYESVLSATWGDKS